MILYSRGLRRSSMRMRRIAFILLLYSLPVSMRSCIAQMHMNVCWGVESPAV